MAPRTNEHGQPIGDSMTDWSARSPPGDVRLEGRFCRIEGLDADRHASDLFRAYSSTPDRGDWTYMSVGPFDSEADFRRHAENAARSTDPRHYAVIDTSTGKAVGSFALMRIDAANGVIEVGFVAFSPLLQRRPASTEAQYLLMQYVFDELRYRRYEWKCDSLNAPSRRTAERLGFSFEGIFRQAVVYKGRSRDTAWFSITDREWPAVKAAFEEWLEAGNFSADGGQVRTLSEVRAGQRSS